MKRSYENDYSQEESERPRLLVLGNFLSAYGRTPQVCEQLALALKTRGWSVLTASDRPGRLPRLWDMLHTAWAMRRRYDVAQVDVFSGPSFWAASAVCRALRALDKPYVLTLHGGRLPEFARRFPRQVRKLLAHAAEVTAPSRYLVEAMSPYRPDIVLLANPVVIGSYAMRLRVDPQPRLLWLRAFHRDYNPSLAPAVLASLLPDFPGASLTMIGPDKEDGSFAETIALARQLGVEHRVLTPGFVEKGAIPEWLDDADVFLNTTNVDNTPISVLEAMASGLCVVSTKVGGIPYFIENEREALLVAPANAGAMAQAVKRVLTEEGLAQRLSAGARRKAELFEAGSVFDHWEHLFLSLASQDPTA